MKRFSSSTLSCLFAMIIGVTAFGVDGRADTNQPTTESSMNFQFKKGSWVTMVPEQEGYQIRLLTTEDKEKAGKTVEDYRKMRSGGSAKADAETWTRVSAAYRSLPADLRTGRFSQIVKLGPDFVELKDTELHVILPIQSIRIVVLGPVGDPAGSGGRSSSGGGGMMSGMMISGSGDSRALAAMLGGGSDDAEEDVEELKIFTLLHADAAGLSQVLDELYGKQRDLRIVPEERTNAIIVKGDHDTLVEIEAVISRLDNEVPVKSADK